MLPYLLMITALTSGEGRYLLSDPPKSWPKNIDQINNRIIGGQESSMYDTPWQVATLVRTGMSYSHACGGAIIKANAILTAAHCSDGTTVDMWKIRAGSEVSILGGEFIEVLKIVIHPDYPYPSNRYDADLSIYYTYYIPINGHTMAVVPLPEQDEPPVPEGAEVTVSGWGANSPWGPKVSFLRIARAPVVERRHCAEAYWERLNVTITPRMMCAGGNQTTMPVVYACYGDSGGPLVYSGRLVGVVTKTAIEPCGGRHGLPFVATRVASYRRWIDDNLPQN